jgi:hypothetical protein
MLRLDLERCPYVVAESSRSLALSTRSGHTRCPEADVRVAATGRRNVHQQGENDPHAQPEPVYEFDQCVAW